MAELNPTGNANHPWHWGWSAILAAITLTTLAYRYALPLRDGDLWFHMLYGKYFLDHKTLIPDHTIFSWTPSSNDAIYCTWLPDIFFYLLHQAAGLAGLFAFRYLCLSVLILACLLYARKLKIAAHPLVWLICLIALLMSYTAAFAKPEIISFLLMTLTVWNWWHIRSGGEQIYRFCYIFPAIMLMWVNSHGAFIFGSVFLLLIGLAEVMNGWLFPRNALPSRTRKHLFIALVLSACTIFITPYGYHYPLQLFLSLIPTAENLAYGSQLAAHTAPLSVDANTQTFADYANTATIILILLILPNLKARKVEWSTLLTNLVFAFLYTKFMRTTFFWAPVFAFSSIHLLSCHSNWLQPPKQALRFLTGMVVVFCALFLSIRSIHESYVEPELYAWPGFGLHEAHPVEEAEFINTHYPGYRLGNTYDQGSYLLWTLWPENKIFIDARLFPFREWSKEYWQFSHGKNIAEFISKYPCDIWCISLVASPETCLWFYRSPDWNLAFYSKSSAVFVRKGIPLPEAPRTGKGLDEIKNIVVASKCFLFSINIKDFPAAQRIANRVEQYFGSRRPKEAEATSSFYKGVVAYHDGDYKQAAAHLAATDRRLIKNDGLLLYSHLLAAATAWREGKDDEALLLSRTILRFFPYHPYAVFNTAVMEWYLAGRTKREPSRNAREAGGLTPLDWGTYLEVFARETPKNQKTTEFIQIAQDILAGNYRRRPKLMLPADPTRPSLSIKPE